jgi:hypothetical protein
VGDVDAVLSKAEAYGCGEAGVGDGSCQLILMS